MSADKVLVHPAPVRITHWVNLLAMAIMVLSGWRIYDASPLFAFRFAEAITLGGWLAGALQWHFAAMWLLLINGLVSVAYGIISGHYRRHYLPLTLSSLLAALGDALHGRLPHQVGVYNPLQRVAYLGVLAIAVILVLSGLSIWKPVQLQELTAVFGGYDAARVWHFCAMSALVLFAVIHVVMVILVPRTFLPMLTGSAGRSKESS